jgi:hypothetical protein
MSAFIISKSDMDDAIHVLVGSGEANAFPYATATDLGRHLFAMNIAAVQTRYGGEDVNDLPGPCEDVSGYPTEYEAPDCTASFPHS